MLNKMRQSAGSWIIKILLGLVVLAFVFMGAGTFNSGRINKAASVNGKPISIKEYQQTYQNIIGRLRQQFGQRVDNEMLEMMNVKKQAMDQLIEAELLRQTAEKYNIQVVPDELAESITQIPAFQKNGRFNQQQYKMILNHNRLSPATFEAMQRQSMLVKKLQSIVSSGIQVSAAEARQWYNWQNKKIKIHYAAFKPDDFTDLEIEEPAIKTYYENHKNDYQIQPKLKARYVRFSPSDFSETAVVSEDDIKAYYNDNQEQYRQAESVKARHILFKVPQNASDELVAEKRVQAEKIMETARSGKDFAELARTHSEGPTKDKGGDLGRFARDEMVKPFADKAFAMEPGEISEPVRTRFGWHIIKVEEKSPESMQPLPAVKEKIREALVFEKAKNKAYDEAVAMYNISFSGKDLIENTKGREDVAVQTTDYFDRKNGPESVANAAEFARVAFSLPLMDVSDVNEIGDAFYLIQVIDKQEATIPSLQTVRTEVHRDLMQQEQKKAAEKATGEFLENVKAARSITEAGRIASVEIRTTDFFQRHQAIPEIGRDSALTSSAFNLSEAHPYPEAPVKGKKAFYVIAFADKESPESGAFDKEKKRMVQQLLRQKQSRFMDSWIAQLRAESDIEISRQLIN